MEGLQQSEELTNTVMNEKGCIGYDVGKLAAR